VVGEGGGGLQEHWGGKHNDGRDRGGGVRLLMQQGAGLGVAEAMWGGGCF
jgi:hypothetical protein